jgi:hypothetical protein
MGDGPLRISEPKADEWVRSEQRSFRIALVIALAPIPIALLIAWALGDLPWGTAGDRGEIHQPGPNDLHPRGPAMDHLRD